MSLGRNLDADRSADRGEHSSRGRSLARFRELVKRRAGLDIAPNAERNLAESIAARMAALASPHEEAYFALVKTDEAEFNRLVGLLTIKETYFCRDLGQLSFFSALLAPRLLEARAGASPVRILSAGCSSGEEVYSIGIVLAERYGERASSLFSIVGCDIDNEALERARSGVYRAFSFRGLDERRKKAWFEAEGGSRWRIKDEIARMAEFRRVNLADEAWPADFGLFDAVFFRNVSIYFDADTRRKMQEHLAEILLPHGCLIIGAAETLANDLGVFALRSEAGNFYFAHPATSGAEPLLAAEGGLESEGSVGALGAPLGAEDASASRAPSALTASRRHKLLPAHGSSLTRRRATSSQGRAEDRADTEAIRAMVREKRLDEALAAMGRAEGVEASAPLATLRAFIELERRNYDESTRLARRALESDDWSVDACMVLGLAARRRGQVTEAITWFKKATYASNRCWPAHFNLAELYREEGERERALREYRIVIHALGSRADSDGGLAIVPLDLPTAYLALLCQRRLRDMAG